jgi:integrase
LMYTTNFALFCRLRFEEVVRLEIEDIDSNRKLIYLTGAKEKKIDTGFVVYGFREF